MDSKETLKQYFLGSQLTNLITLDEFQRVVSKSLGNGPDAAISSEQIKEWYEAYQQQDRIEQESLRLRVDRFLDRIERDELCNMEKTQLKESFTLEELVDNLYRVNQVLDSRLETLNGSFESIASVFEQLNRILVKANNEKKEWDMDVVDTLIEYKRIIQSEEADSEY